MSDPVKPTGPFSGPREVRPGVPTWARSSTDAVSAWVPAVGQTSPRGPDAHKAAAKQGPGQGQGQGQAQGQAGGAPKSRSEKRPRAQVPSRPMQPLPPPPGPTSIPPPEAAPVMPELPPGAMIVTQEEIDQHDQEIVNLLREPFLRAALALEEARNELVSRIHEDVVDLAARLASALLQREVKLDRTVTIDVVQRALRLAGPLESVTIKCSEEDAELIRERAPGLARIEAGRPVEVTVRPSDDIQPGGCVLTWDGGVVDARNERRLDRIIEAVKTAVSE